MARPIPERMTLSRILTLAVAVLGLTCTAAAADGAAPTKPEALRTPPPELPSEFRGQEVLATVTIHIDEDGKVTEVDIHKVSHAGAEDPIKQAVKRWKFKPSLDNGVAVKSKVSIPLRVSM